MSLQKAIEVVAALERDGVIQGYAIAGAVAALNYIQPTLTEDLDILISFRDFGKHQSGLLLLAPIEQVLVLRGYTERSDVGYMIEGWPVQFLPVSSALDEEALERAVDVDFGAADEAMKARCLRAEHIVAIALRVGRLKDLARVQAFLDRDAVDLDDLRNVLERHALMDAWRAFCLKAGIQNPLGLS